jgi:hypothetical protein
MIAPLLLALLVTGPDDERKSVADAIASLERTEAAIRDLAVVTEYVKLQKYPLKVDRPVHMGLRTEFIVTRDGKGWYDCVGEQVNSGPDFVKTYPGHWRCAYDGETARTLTGDVHGSYHSASIDRFPAWHGVNPLEYTTHYNREPVSQTLKERPAVFVCRDTWEGRPVVILETPATINGGAYKSRFWIDPERRIVVRRALMLQREPGKSPWYEYSRIESRDHREIAPGIWLPMRFKYESVTPLKDGKPEELAWSYEGTNSAWKVNQDPPTSTFRLEFPPDVPVNDHRRPPPAGAVR